MVSLIPPINIQVPIVDPATGRPTTDFQRMLQKLSLSGALTVTNGQIGIADDSITNAKLANMANKTIKARKTAAAGDPEDCTLSEVLDFITSAAHGDILYRGAATWARLAAGTSGQVLTTGGAGADPSWAAAAGGSSSEGSRVVPLAANFTIQNAGADTITNRTYGLDLQAPSVATQIRFVRRNGAPPTTPYTITVRGQHLYPDMGNSYGLCIILRNNTSGRISIFGDYQNNQILVQNWTAYNTFSATVGILTLPMLLETPWRRLVNDGTTLSWEISTDKVTWEVITTATIASFMTATGGTIDEIGIGCMLNLTKIRTMFQSYEAA